jgi:ArsR family transcriptional regulator
MLLALTHVEAPAAALAEMARIVRPGGRAVVVDLLRHDREAFRRQMGQLRTGFEARELSGLLADAGFEGARCAPLPAEPEAKGPALLLASATRAAVDSARSRSTDSAGPRASAGQPPLTTKLFASKKGSRR